MHMKKLTALYGVLASVAVSCTPVYAADWGSLLQDFTARNGSASGNGYGNGSTSQLTAAQLVTLQNLEVQTSMIKNQIDSAAASDRMTSMQAESLRDELHLISRYRRAALDSGNLDFTTASQMVSMLDTLQAHMNAQFGTAGIAYGSSDQNSDLVRSRNRLANRLERAHREGRIGLADFTNMQLQLSALSRRLTDLPPGRPNCSQATNVQTKLNQLDNELSSSISTNNVNYNYHEKWD